MGHEGDRPFPLAVLGAGISRGAWLCFPVALPGCSWRWLVEEGTPREEGTGSSSFQLLVHLVSGGTSGTGEPVCPSIKVAACE